MLPAFSNRLVFTDHGDASYFGMGPWSVLEPYLVNPFDGHSYVQIRGRDAFGEIRTLEAYDDFLNTDGMTLI